jgi:hypothetical protein
MRRLLWALLLVFSAAALIAQPAPQPPLLFIHEEIAKPSMLGDYESTTKELGAMLRANNIPFHFDVASTDDFHYYYFTPINGFADLDKIVQTFFVDLPKKAGAQKVGDLMRRGGASMEMTREWVFIRRDDISYKPAKPRIAPGQATYFQYDVYYLKPGMEEMVEPISREWAAALQAANISNGFTLYQGILGGEMPAVVVVHEGTSMADLVDHANKDMGTLGDTGRALIAKTFGAVRRFETKYARLRPDLSNPAPQAATK